MLAMELGISRTMPSSGSSAWQIEMRDMRFGDNNFWIVLEGVDHRVPDGDSQILLRFEGQGWRVGGEDYESFGVVVPKIISFGRNGAARHWGAFVGARTATEVIERVTSYVFPPGVDSLTPWHWDISSALFAYVFSALFDANLGARCVLVVRGQRHETIIVQSEDGAVQTHDVPVNSFDHAIDELSEWLHAVEAGRIRQ